MSSRRFALRRSGEVLSQWGRGEGGSDGGLHSSLLQVDIAAAGAAVQWPSYRQQYQQHPQQQNQPQHTSAVSTRPAEAVTINSTASAATTGATINIVCSGDVLNLCSFGFSILEKRWSGHNEFEVTLVMSEPLSLGLPALVLRVNLGCSGAAVHNFRIMSSICV